MDLTALFAQLALEYNCPPAAFTAAENLVFPVALHPGRRVYSQDAPFFQMVSTGGNAVIMADEKLHPFLREFIRDSEGYRLFETPNLLEINRELARYGQTLTATHHMFLPAAEVQPKLKLPVRWYFGEEIHPFYGDARLPNAICPQFDPNRPDRICVAAWDGENLMGMAGCSEDAPHWMQIGIDVMPEYRSRGIGTYLVTLLKNAILERGEIPFYGTDTGNYHSWNIAIGSGFRPAWLETGARPITK